MMFLIHSETESGNIVQNLGVSEYSYYFVLKEFRVLLEEMGIVVGLSNPAQEADRIWENATRHGEDCVFLTFSPPHRSFIPARCPTVPVFAWEFDTLPTEVWDEDPRHDWRGVLRQAGRAVTHSKFAVETTKAAMGQDFSVISLPAPVWDGHAGLYDAQANAVARSAGIRIRGRVFDTRTIDLKPYSAAGRRLLETPASLPAEAGTKESFQDLVLDGVIYSSVFCPIDGRKNWFDMICGFCMALRDAQDATLVLKLTHRDSNASILAMLEDLAKLQPFRCRVVLIDGYLPDDAYMRLIELSSYTVNTSHGEGQCLPLMEYMSAGKPAIAPTHTGMADYITPANAFTLSASREPAMWPHDPRRAFRARQYRINFETLIAAYKESYDVAKHQPARYAQMAAAAHFGLKEHCSRAKIRAGLEQFLQPLALAAE